MVVSGCQGYHPTSSCHLVTQPGTRQCWHSSRLSWQHSSMPRLRHKLSSMLSSKQLRQQLTMSRCQVSSQLCQELLLR